MRHMDAEDMRRPLRRSLQLSLLVLAGHTEIKQATAVLRASGPV